MRKYLIYITLFAAIVSCNDNNIGENIYYEVWRGGHKLHVDKDCSDISKSHSVYFIKVKDLTQEFKNKELPLCPKCVSDKDADILKSFITTLPDKTSDYY